MNLPECPPARPGLRICAAALLLLSACPGADHTSDGSIDLLVPLDLRPATPTFLDPSAYAAELAVDAAFPFGVTRRHTTARTLAGARFGGHGGPMTTSRPPGAQAQVIRFTLPAAATAPLTDVAVPVATPSGLPASAFLADVVDLTAGQASGRLALSSYTGSGAAFPGEALLYSKDYDQVLDRAAVNGFFGLTSLALTGGGTRLLYTGLSGLAAAPAATNDNGLYASDLCGDAIKPGAACTPGKKLFGWSGYSGPVASDTVGTVLAAASLTGGATSDAVYALSAAQARGGAAVTPTPLVESSTLGTESLAAVAPTGAAPGWALAKGYDDATKKTAVAAYAQGYTVEGAAVKKSGALVTQALRPGPAAQRLSLLTDAQGGLWVAVQTQAGGVLLGLARQ